MALPNPKKAPRRRQGTIVSAKMEKTVTVAIERSTLHPKYLKRYRVVKKVLAHAAGNQYQEGDLVTIEECRPLSRHKHWRVIGKITKK